MLKTARRESRNLALNHYENLALNLSSTGLKKALNLLTKKLQEPCHHQYLVQLPFLGLYQRAASSL
jgi:hypothetical protein